MPFINPITDVCAFLPTPYQSNSSVIQWDKEHPEDRQAWSVQHSMLKFLDPPYVYNVFEGDLVGFIEAIEDAVANPIEGFVVCLATWCLTILTLFALVIS